jgi:epoxyqueuosine reductase
MNPHTHEPALLRLSEQIKQEARRIGFDAVGIARVDAAPDATPEATMSARLIEWLRRGYQGGMYWMSRDPERRSHPHLVLPGCRSVVSVGINYYTAGRADEGPEHGRIARYAWGRDYHEVFESRLQTLERRMHALAPEATSRWYVDTGPVMEKAWAQQAGLGWIGKHSNLVSAQNGSWLLLGEILTSLELEADQPGEDLCGSCTLCIRACPTGAIAEPYVVDARRCISYLTIEQHRAGDDTTGHTDDVAADLAAKHGNRIFGCDDCLDACPYNTQAVPTAEPAFQASSLTLAPNLASLATLDEPEFQSLFRGSPVRRAKYHGFLRNVRTSLQNLKSSVSR